MTPAVSGLLAGIGSAVVIVLGGLLFKAVPHSKRKPVAISMMVMGGLMLVSNVLYANGLIKASDALDVLFIGLLFGGFFVCITGFALYQKITRSQPDPEA